MMRWPTKHLGELCDVEGGNAAPQGDQHFKNGTIPFVRMKDLGRHHFTTNLCTTDDRLTPESATANRMKMFDPGCILFPRSGSVALNHRAILGVRACIVSHIGILKNVRPEVTPAFLYTYLTTFDMTALSKKTTGVDSIAFTDVKKIPIPVPPLPEQERIVALLDEADALRKLRAQADRRMDDLIPALFQEMFGDTERNTANWPTTPVSAVCDLVRGSSPRPKSDPRYYGGPVPRLMIEDITRDGWSVTPRVDSLTELGATMSRPVKAGTIVMAVSGNIGLCAQLAVDACVHDGFVAFKDLRTDTFVPLFFGMAMGLMRKVHQRNQAGAIFQNITTTDVKAMAIPVPPLPLQQEFAQRVTEIREMQARQADSLGRLDALFGSMLHRAFSGEL